MRTSLSPTLIHESNLLKLKRKDNVFNEKNTKLTLEAIRSFHKTNSLHIKELLKLVEDFLSKEGVFFGKEVMVYPTVLVKSFSHPLFLRIGDIKYSQIKLRPDFLIVGQLIHELIHHRCVDLKIGKDEREKLVESKTVHLLRKLNFDWSVDYEKFVNSFN